MRRRPALAGLEDSNRPGTHPQQSLVEGEGITCKETNELKRRRLKNEAQLNGSESTEAGASLGQQAGAAATEKTRSTPSNGRAAAADDGDAMLLVLADAAEACASQADVSGQSARPGSALVRRTLLAGDPEKPRPSDVAAQGNDVPEVGAGKATELAHGCDAPAQDAVQGLVMLRHDAMRKQKTGADAGASAALGLAQQHATPTSWPAHRAVSMPADAAGMSAPGPDAHASGLPGSAPSTGGAGAVNLANRVGSATRNSPHAAVGTPAARAAPAQPRCASAMQRMYAAMDASMKPQPPSFPAAEAPAPVAMQLQHDEQLALHSMPDAAARITSLRSGSAAGSASFANGNWLAPYAPGNVGAASGAVAQRPRRIVSRRKAGAAAAAAALPEGANEEPSPDSAAAAAAPGAAPRAESSPSGSHVHGSTSGEVPQEEQMPPLVEALQVAAAPMHAGAAARGQPRSPHVGNKYHGVSFKRGCVPAALVRWLCSTWGLTEARMMVATQACCELCRIARAQGGAAAQAHSTMA